IDPGFNAKNLLTVNINLPASRYQDNPRVTAFLRSASGKGARVARRHRSRSDKWVAELVSSLP
ncbi:MAG: hypothetical protein ABI882_20745, partial [Acidobacteriota bacterium]